MNATGQSSRQVYTRREYETVRTSRISDHEVDPKSKMGVTYSLVAPKSQKDLMTRFSSQKSIKMVNYK